MLYNLVAREGPGLFIFDTCAQFMPTVPSTPKDERGMDDVDTDTEDHVTDEVRYRCLFRKVVTVVEQGYSDGRLSPTFGMRVSSGRHACCATLAGCMDSCQSDPGLMKVFFDFARICQR